MDPLTKKKRRFFSRDLFGAARFLGKNRLSVGVDVGSQFMKVVILGNGPDKLVLQDYAVFPVSGDPPEEAAQGIRNVDQIHPYLKGREDWFKGGVGIAVSGPSIFIKSLSLPFMEEDDLREHFHWELDRYISSPGEEVFWDLYTGEHLPIEVEGQQSHLLVVAKAQVIKVQVEQWKSMGIPVNFVDVAPLALVNMVTNNYDSTKPYLVIQLGPSGILIVNMEMGEPIHIHEIPYEVDWYGELVEQVCFPRNDYPKEIGIGPSETLLLEKFIDDVAQQIGEIVKEESRGQRKMSFQHVLLSGGYGRVDGLTEKLSDVLGHYVEIISPFKKIRVPKRLNEDADFQNVSPLLSVAVGVAMRGALQDDQD